MLSPANADLVRRDARLPGLATLLDPEAFLTALKASAPEAELRAARLRYLRYKPGQNCLAAYTLEFSGGVVECHAKAYRRADVVKLAKAGLRPASPSPLGKGRFIWPEPRIEVCVFPNDNKVGSLAVMAEPGQREDFLQRHLPRHPALWQSEIRALAYKPERRWVGALELNGQPQAVCKLYGGPAFDAIRSRSKWIKPGDVLRVARMLGWSKGRRALFFSWQDGRVLSEKLLEPTFNPADLERVGVALAELHRQKISALLLLSRTAEASALLELGELLAFILPESAGRIVRTGQTLARSLGELPPQAATIHGDFYAKQVLVGSENLTVLDFDEAARGDPLSDLGTFLAHVERELICARMTSSRRDAIREALLAGYRFKEANLASHDLDLYVAAKLFARMPHYFRTCDPDWAVLTIESLARVEALLGMRRSGRTVATPNQSPTLVADGALPTLSRALDPAVVGPLLESALREHDSGIATVNLHYARLRRHKPGRRALIEYALECRHRDGRVVPLALLGKLHRRGVDVENLKLIAQLLADDFSGESEDLIAIPKLMGRIPELSLWLQENVIGRSAGKLLLRPAGLAVARRAAEAVGKLHRSKLPLRRRHTVADELNLLQERLATVALQRPTWQERLANLSEACTRLAAELPVVPARPIHRDFYHDQLVLDGERVWLVDLDLLCAGDPALDAGNFVGHLLEWAVRSPANQPALARAAAAFTGRYLELAEGTAEQAIETYTTLTLARHVFISTQFPDRTPFTETILNLCEERCGIARMVARGAAFAASTT